MANVRLFLVFAAIAALGYVAYRHGWFPIPFNNAVPSPEATLGFTVHQTRPGRHRHLSHGHNLGQELASRWGMHVTKSRPAPESSTMELAAVRKPGSNLLEIPAAPEATATSTPTTPQAPFPKSFEGCWSATVTQPEAWTFGRGPVVKGISPSTYTLCFRYRGTTPDVTFSTTAEYPVVSDWVVSHVGVENGHTDVLYSGDNLVILRTSSSTPLQMKILNLLPGPTGTITSLTDFHCTYLPSDKLLVEASTVQRCINAHSIDCDGDMWIKESWHTEFSRQ
ncbi:MAG TPA: hypothetical protein VKB84_20905 [Candidatus Binataceae bacterium]|nr:hypothetical protein [Candidatus Binataceae bacterium]